MNDATRRGEDGSGELEAARAAALGIVDELTHLVLGLFHRRGLELSERITLAGGDPLEVLDLFVATLRVLAEGLEEPNLDWVN